MNENRPLVRQALCRSRHELFTAAKLIVTSKIHVALPCLGIGKPVVFIRQNIVAPGRLRALPEGFRTYEAGSAEVWKMDLTPESHGFDASSYREHVRNCLLKRL